MHFSFSVAALLSVLLLAWFVGWLGWLVRRRKRQEENWRRTQEEWMRGDPCRREEQYVPDGYYVVEDADGERFVKKPRCRIKHQFGGQTCIRDQGHDGLCRCRAERMGGGAVVYSEWESRDGHFVSHVGYRAIYPKNAETHR